MSEPIKVVAAAMHLLHESACGIDEPTGLEHAFHFGCGGEWISNMFDDPLRDDPVERCIGKRQLLSIAHDLCPRSHRRVGIDQTNVRMVDKFFHAITEDAA